MHLNWSWTPLCRVNSQAMSWPNGNLSVSVCLGLFLEADCSKSTIRSQCSPSNKISLLLDWAVGCVENNLNALLNYSPHI